MFGDFSVPYPINVNFSPANLFVRRLLAHQRCTVRRDRGTSFDDLIAGCYHIFLDDDHIWEGGIHPPADIFEASQSRLHGWSEVMLKVRGKQVMDSIHAMFILKHTGELAHDF